MRACYYVLTFAAALLTAIDTTAYRRQLAADLRWALARCRVSADQAHDMIGEDGMLRHTARVPVQFWRELYAIRARRYESQTVGEVK